MIAIIATGIIIDLSKDYTKKKIKKWYRKYWTKVSPCPIVQVTKRINENVSVIKILNRHELEKLH